MQREGTYVVAQAKYERDFAALRKRSLDGGCLYQYMEMSGDEFSGNYGSKGSLWKYVGYVFGELDMIYTLVRPRDPYR
jgi:hypothetical protein